MAAAGGANEVKYAQRPNTLKGLRACRVCKLIKTLEQFTESYCENCWMHWSNGAPPSGLSYGERSDTAQENTTTDYEGMVALMRPTDSWVARWLRMHKVEAGRGRVLFKPGLYAISLPGEEIAAASGKNAEAEEEYEDEEAEEDAGDGEGTGEGAPAGGNGAAGAGAGAGGGGGYLSAAGAERRAAAAIDRAVEKEIEDEERARGNVFVDRDGDEE